MTIRGLYTGWIIIHPILITSGCETAVVLNELFFGTITKYNFKQDRLVGLVISMSDY